MPARPDLKDIESTVEHLLLLGDYFWDNTRVWSKLWCENSGTYSMEYYLDKTKDKEFSKAVEDVYYIGDDTALAMANTLPKINNVSDFPRLKDYVEEIKAYQDQADLDEKVLSDCKKIILKKNKYEVNYIAITQMLALNTEQIKILRGLVSELRVIEGSERYRIEEQGLPLSKDGKRITTPGQTTNSQEVQPKQIADLAGKQKEHCFIGWRLKLALGFRN